MKFGSTPIEEIPNTDREELYESQLQRWLNDGCGVNVERHGKTQNPKRKHF